MIKPLILSLLLSVLATLALAGPDTQTQVQKLQQQWAIANYETTGKAQRESFETLIHKADRYLKSSPDSPELLIWRGIIKSTYAGVKGGLGALSLAKGARKDLEAALDLAPEALDGSAYTSLGTLYAKVPGWPLGFGNDDKARELLERALKINPDGIDSNYFYGDFLLAQKDYQEAQTYLQKALQAAPRPNRPIADRGRRAEIDLALKTIRAKLKR